MTDIIQSPAFSAIINDDGVASIEFMTWLDQVSKALSSVEPIVGSGSPEGAIVASVGRWYVDADSSGTGIYLKESGDGDTGWQARS